MKEQITQPPSPTNTDASLDALLQCVHAAGDAGRDALLNAGHCVEDRLNWMVADLQAPDAKDESKIGFSP